MDDQKAELRAPRSCPNCGNPMRLGELLNAPDVSPYPGVRCEAVLDCEFCGGVFLQWLAAGAPLTPMPEETRALRAGIIAKRESDSH